MTLNLRKRFLVLFYSVEKTFSQNNREVEVYGYKESKACYDLDTGIFDGDSKFFQNLQNKVAYAGLLSLQRDGSEVR